MSAAVWDVLAKAANLAQVSGLHAAMLVAVLTTLLRVHQKNKLECARLERCHRRLRALLQWPPPTCGCGGAVLLLCSEMGDPFGKALGDAAGLIDSYKKSTLWRRVRGGGSTATRLRDMQDVVNSYCGVLLFVNAHLLLQQQATRHPPPHPVPAPSDDSSTTIDQANDTSSRSPSSPAGTGAQRSKDDIDQEGTDSDIAGCERVMPSLLPIVISHA